jgi:endonuclease/exonuclease/phosphatase family metal-dependent hydrolase
LKNISFILLIFTLVSCKSIPAYLDKNEPAWYENKYRSSDQESSFLAISYNIENGKRIDEAIEYLKTDTLLNKVSILFLQEVDEVAVQKISSAFSFNYIFYPISYHEKQEQNYGNAILTRFNMVSHSKIILPNEKWTNKRKRAATQATILVGTDSVHLYSVHLETIVMKKIKRLEQVESILADYINNHPDQKCIIGGDFNTLNKKYLRALVEKFKKAGFIWASNNIGSTSKAFFQLIKPSNDHFFSFGLEYNSVGKGKHSNISDHVPIWVDLKNF